MDKVSFNEVPRRGKEDLAESLFVLRDSLVQLAMMFRDLQFEIDNIKREQASVEADRIVRRMREITIEYKTIGHRGIVAISPRPPQG